MLFVLELSIITVLAISCFVWLVFISGISKTLSLGLLITVIVSGAIPGVSEAVLEGKTVPFMLLIPSNPTFKTAPAISSTYLIGTYNSPTRVNALLPVKS